jgi:nitroimidazol reductase NimA-like FMN-containing flavoprotein (pyridoxamine 5'-phosphate oxidase superfamily)
MSSEALRSLQSDRTTLRRMPDRGAYDEATIHPILDEALLCHLGFAIDGQPFVIPTIHARIGGQLYVHGAVANRMLRAIAGGAPCCVTVTLLDGLVLARSAFHHSMNFRSVVVLGSASEVTDTAEKQAAFEAIVEKVVRGRAAHSRPANEVEIRTTKVLRMPLTEASAKVRTGPPIDDEEDYALPWWAGVIPLRVVAGEPEVDARTPAGTAFPHDLARDVGSARFR